MPARTSTAVQRYAAGHKVKDLAAQLGISRTTVYKWINRFAAVGPAGLADRSSRPGSSPRQVSLAVELRVLAARVELHVGPVQLATELGLPASTIGSVLRRWAVPLLADLDRLSGELIRSRVTEVRSEHPRPGDLLHVDVKKLGRIPGGGGWRLEGPLTSAHRSLDRTPVGFDFIHVAVDDHTRIAYAEVLPDEKAGTCASFLHRAAPWFHEAHQVTIRPVLTDNAMSYRRGIDCAAVCSALQIRRRFIRPGCPWTNGKSRTVQPHPAHRMGLRPSLAHQRRADRCL